MRFYVDSFGGGMNRGCNFVNVADVVSTIMPEIFLYLLIN
jgi:hypothetical protein